MNWWILIGLDSIALI